MGKFIRFKNLTTGSDTSNDPHEPDKTIHAMRKFIRKNYDGANQGGYSLRTNAKFRVRKQDDYCRMCSEVALCLLMTRGLKERVNKYFVGIKVLRRTGENSEIGYMPGHCESCWRRLESGASKMEWNAMR